MEQKALAMSVVGAAAMALSGIGFAALTGSEAILLDGLFSLVSGAMGLVSLRTARLVQAPSDSHYHFGYASYEPFVNALKGVIMAILGIFAVFSSVSAILEGGRPIATGYALLYAVFGAAVCLTIAWQQKRIARTTHSPLVDVDAKGWLIDGLITSAVCFAFIGVALLERSSFAHLAPYADPVLVIILVVGSSFLPYGILRSNLRELLMGAPVAEEQAKITTALSEATQGLPIDGSMIRMNRMGRSLYLHVYLVVAESHRSASVAELDSVRADIADRLTPSFPGLSLDIAFTLDHKWAGVDMNNR